MVVRVNKTKDYTVMSNRHLMDHRLTLKAKGLLSVVLSLPDDWKYSVPGLTAISREKETSINSALKELKECGYLVITKKMPNQTRSGRIEYEWDFYEMPVETEQTAEKQGIENQGLENQGLEVQGLENLALYKYTNKENTNKESTNEVNTDFISGKKKNFVPPTVEEVYQYCDERHNGINPQLFVDFYSAKNWMIGKNKMRDWKAAVRTWENNQKQEEW